MIKWLKKVAASTTKTQSRKRTAESTEIEDDLKKKRKLFNAENWREQSKALEKQKLEHLKRPEEREELKLEKLGRLKVLEEKKVGLLQRLLDKL